MRRTTITAAVLAAAVLAGCSSGTGAGGSGSAAGPATSTPASGTASTPVPTDTVTRTHTVPPSSSSPSSSSSAPRSTASGPGPCGDGDLAISASDGNGASEHNRYVLWFHNTSGAPCTLHGYPGLDALAASGSVLAHAKRVPSGFMGGSRHGVPTVPVAAGQYASAIVEWQLIQPGTGDACDKQSARIAVTAANTRRSVVLDKSVTACGLEIHPTVPGRTGDLM